MTEHCYIIERKGLFKNKHLEAVRLEGIFNAPIMGYMYFWYGAFFEEFGECIDTMIFKRGRNTYIVTEVW